MLLLDAFHCLLICLEMKYVPDCLNLPYSSSSSEEEEGEGERRGKIYKEKTTAALSAATAAPAAADLGNYFFLAAVETKTFTEGFSTLVAEIQVADFMPAQTWAGLARINRQQRNFTTAKYKFHKSFFSFICFSQTVPMKKRATQGSRAWLVPLHLSVPGRRNRSYIAP